MHSQWDAQAEDLSFSFLDTIASEHAKEHESCVLPRHLNGSPYFTQMLLFLC